MDDQEQDRLLRDLLTKVAVIEERVARLEREQGESAHTVAGLAAKFVSKDRFGLVEKAVYTFVAAVVLGFIGAVMKVIEWVGSSGGAIK